MSYVTEFPAAEPQEAVGHFLRRLSVETDCADVHHAVSSGDQDFVLLHVVGKPEHFARRHLPGALHLPLEPDHRRADESVARGHAVCRLLCRPALQRGGQGGAEAGASGSAGQDYARGHHRLGR